MKLAASKPRSISHGSRAGTSGRGKDNEACRQQLLERMPGCYWMCIEDRTEVEEDSL